MRTSSPPTLAVSTSQPFVPAQPISLKGSSIKGDSQVYGSAQVLYTNLKGSVEVSGHAYMKHSNISGSVKVGERAVISHSTISENAVVLGSANIKHSKLRDNAVATDNVVIGHATLKGNARARGNAQIKHSNIEDDSVVEGQAVVKQSKLKGRSLVTGESEVNGCNIIDSVVCHGATVSDSNFSNHWICGMLRTEPLDGKFEGRDDPRVVEHLGTFSPISPFYSESGYSLPPPTPTKDPLPSSPASPPSAHSTPLYTDANPKGAPPSYDEVTSVSSTARRLGSLRIDHSRGNEKANGFGYHDSQGQR